MCESVCVCECVCVCVCVCVITDDTLILNSMLLTCFHSYLTVSMDPLSFGKLGIQNPVITEIPESLTLSEEIICDALHSSQTSFSSSCCLDSESRCPSGFP